MGDHRRAAVVSVVIGVVAAIVGGAAGITGAHAARPLTCAPCTYDVSPSGTGVHDLTYVLANLVQSGDTVVLADGVYRVGEMEVNAPNVTIRAANPWISAPHVWLDGSIPYLHWNGPGAVPGTSTRLWWHAYDKDFCKTGLGKRPCASLGVAYRGDQMFQSGQPVAQTINVADLADGSQHRFYVDTVAHRIYTNFDPVGVEVTEHEIALAFTPSSSNSELVDIGVRRYAGNDHLPVAGAGRSNAAVYVDNATGVKLMGDMFSFNAVRGVKTQGDVPPAQTPVAGAHVLIDHSTFDHNGQLGLNSVESDDIMISNSVFYRNNTEGFDPSNEAGGAKLHSVHGAVIEGTNFTANIGQALWFDSSAYDALIAGNTFAANTYGGVDFEISARATITGNTFVGNARNGVLIFESSHSSISHNLFRGNYVGIEVAEDIRTLANFPIGRDMDPDRPEPPEITFNVSAIDVHSNGFYYAPIAPNGATCDRNPAALPTVAEPKPFDGCQYAIAVHDWEPVGRPAAALGIVPDYDNFHRRGAPADPLAGATPTFIALWKAPASLHPAPCPSGTLWYRYVSLSAYQCAHVESHAATPW
jgi:parallel beta-helix repeat protein